VGLNLDYPPGATPLDHDEAAGLIPAHITTLDQLNEWELANIVEGERWAFARRRKDLLVQNGAKRFTWGAGDLVGEGDARQRYIQALRAADGHDYAPLLAFVRSGQV
jgi:hypothetical protein